MIVGEETTRLRHPPDLHHGNAETGLKRLMDGGVEARAEAEFHGMRAFLRRFGFFQKDRRDDAEIMHPRRPRLRQIAPPCLRVEPVRQDQAIGGQDHGGQRIDPGVYVKDRERNEQSLRPMVQRQTTAELGVPEADGEMVFMVEDAALRATGRAGRVNQRRLGFPTGFAARRAWRIRDFGKF